MLTVLGAIAPAAWLYLSRAATSLERLLTLAGALAWFAFAFLVGAWLFVGLSLRWLTLVLFAAGLARFSARWWRDASWPAAPQRVRLTFRQGSLLILTVVGAALAADVAWSRADPREAVALAFPLRDGRFGVIQGGTRWLTNPFHFAGAEDRHALDLVALTSLGRRAHGLFPARLEAYAVFGRSVVSPCTGTVVAVRADHEDNAPGAVRFRDPAGNHVRVRCGDVQVLLAHLRGGSVVVWLGAAVREGQTVGAVGNSGNSLEPHLHIGAAVLRAGRWEPVAMRFAGRTLTVNDVVSPLPRAASRGAPRPDRPT
jgi:hypothetical protein